MTAENILGLIVMSISGFVVSFTLLFLCRSAYLDY